MNDLINFISNNQKNDNFTLNIFSIKIEHIFEIINQINIK